MSTMLPIDDDDPPRRRAVMDEVAEIHAAEAAGIPHPALGTAPPGTPTPLSPTSPPPLDSSLPPPAPGGLGAPLGGLGAPLGGGLTSPSSMANMGAMAANQSAFGMGMGMNNGAAAAVMAQSTAAQAQAQASVGLAQTALDQKVIDEQINKEEEHWVKSYWRPMMGWLYMAICFMDFIGFPAISMFLPIIFRKDGINAAYVAWQSITLSNGGLIHLAFGAILGVSAWTRGQEKLQR